MVYKAEKKTSVHPAQPVILQVDPEEGKANV
jgi:hypothetical protein